MSRPVRRLPPKSRGEIIWSAEMEVVRPGRWARGKVGAHGKVLALNNRGEAVWRSMSLAVWDVLTSQCR